KLGLLALVVWGVHHSLFSAWQKLEEHHWNLSQWHPGWLVAGGLLYLAGQFPWAVFWWRVLRVLGQPSGLFESLRAWYIGQLGKYVPGKAMVIVLRAGMLRAGGATAAAATVAVFFETLTTMSIGAALAAIVIAVRFPSERWLLAIAIGLWAVVSGPTTLPVFRRLARMGAGRFDPAMAERLVDLRYGTLLRSWFEIGVGWVLVGGSVWTTLVASGYADATNWFDEWCICTAAAALSVVGGFLLFVPGGLLIRESALFEILTPWFGDEGALIAAIASRLVWIIAELLIAAIGFAARTRRTRDELEPKVDGMEQKATKETKFIKGP
ncbi:MAG TPA: lysylphosphatidylglycerol synthase domain-containing protein, partial [Pirellulales bacterium]|nr:lysylphosphatidylglycerol synthase domain-containing protein [Pirellulales bacterium]